MSDATAFNKARIPVLLPTLVTAAKFGAASRRPEDAPRSID